MHKRHIICKPTPSAQNLKNVAHSHIYADGIVSCSCPSVRSRVIVSGQPPPIGDKTHPDRGMWAGPTKLSEFSPLSGWAKALTHTARQLWAPLTPKWAFKAVHPPPLRSGLQRSRPTAPESGKFKPSTPPANVLPFYIQRVPYRNIICSNFRFHKRQSEM